MSGDQAFGETLSALRPRLHRFCARMTGSAIDGEDVVQDVFLRAIDAQARGAPIENWQAWTFQVAHRRSLDLIRARRIRTTVPLPDDLPAPDGPPPAHDAALLGFRLFLQLPPLQRCAVVLKDVLGHSVEEIAGIAGCSLAAAKSALQRGRVRLGALGRATRQDAPSPALPDDERQRLMTYADSFGRGDFDAIRAMLAADVRLDLVGRLELRGRDEVSPYFTRYRDAAHWRHAPGLVEGRAAVLVYDGGAAARPSHFALLDWRDGRIVAIRDFLFAPYVMEGVAWEPLGSRSLFTGPAPE